MSACFQRLDGRPIDADVVYRYRLIDSIVDGNAKNLRVHRFAPDVAQTTYEMVWPDGSREEIVGRDALLELISDERKLARITAKSHEPIRQVMREVRAALDRQAELLYPVKPRVLFAALGRAPRRADRRTSPTSTASRARTLHHSMTEHQIQHIRERFEQDSGDLQGIVQLRMLGQGYDFPPITVVVPMRPYGSFSEFYQFVGRGIRVLTHPALVGRVGPGEQWLDVIYHAELGLDEHIETIYRENDMDPITEHDVPEAGAPAAGPRRAAGHDGARDVARAPGGVRPVRARAPSSSGSSTTRRASSSAARSASGRRSRSDTPTYAQSTETPVTFEQFVEIMRQLSD